MSIKNKEIYTLDINFRYKVKGNENMVRDLNLFGPEKYYNVAENILHKDIYDEYNKIVSSKQENTEITNKLKEDFNEKVFKLAFANNYLDYEIINRILNDNEDDFFKQISEEKDNNNYYERIYSKMKKLNDSSKLESEFKLNKFDSNNIDEYDDYNKSSSISKDGDSFTLNMNETFKNEFYSGGENESKNRENKQVFGDLSNALKYYKQENTNFFKFQFDKTPLILFKLLEIYTENSNPPLQNKRKDYKKPGTILRLIRFLYNIKKSFFEDLNDSGPVRKILKNLNKKSKYHLFLANKSNAENTKITEENIVRLFDLLKEDEQLFKDMEIKVEQAKNSNLSENEKFSKKYAIPEEKKKILYNYANYIINGKIDKNNIQNLNENDKKKIITYYNIHHLLEKLYLPNETIIQDIEIYNNLTRKFEKKKLLLLIKLFQ